ncbi:MAG: SigE family RNA polymerase sigma factor [Actinobacteria bacterium]|nr:SigE family RNA polymerase sigma factor [Actinomycetota bacterium]
MSAVPDDSAARTGSVWRSHSDADAVLSVSELFRDHHLELVRLAVVMVGDVATAEDVVQDCYERLHRSWHVIREPSRALAYARSSVLNGCRSVHRRSAISRRYGPRLAQPADAIMQDATAATADRGQLVAALRQLPRRQREVLVLRYYADLSVAEIAETLAISPGNVRACISRGLAALATAIGEEN